MNNELLKLAIVIPNLNIGGAEKVLVHFVNNLDYNNFQPIIFCLKKEGELLSSVNPEVIIADLDSPRVYFSIFKIRKNIKKYKPDVLIGWMGHVNTFLAFSKPVLPSNLTLMCRESSIPSRFIAHYRLPGLFRFMYRFLNRYDGIICQSDAMKQDLVNNFKVREGKIRTIHNPVSIKTDIIGLSQEAEEFIANAEKVLLFVGRFSKEKKTELLLDVMLALPAEYKLIVIGYGPMEQSIRNNIANMELTGRVHLATNCNNPAAYYKRADCLLLTSSFEGFPNVLLEANMCGCPAVVYKTLGGAHEIINDYNGEYISPDPANDMNRFAFLIKQVCNNPEKYNRERISENAKKEYGVKKIIQQYSEYIKSVIEKKLFKSNPKQFQ